MTNARGPALAERPVPSSGRPGFWLAHHVGQPGFLGDPIPDSIRCLIWLREAINGFIERFENLCHALA
jgi:hypothetical protein